MFAMDLDHAAFVTKSLSLTTDRATIRRVVRANDIFRRGLVSLQLNHSGIQVYEVCSQNNPDLHYTVLRNGIPPICNCPDDVRICKHGIAVLLAEKAIEEEAWIAQIDEYEADRFACYPEDFDLRWEELS